MKIELNCAECGNNRFSYPEKLKNESVIICQDCGHEIGTIEHLKELVAEEVISRSSRA